MNKKYLHVLSFDGLSRVDIEKMKKLPAFCEFFKLASGCINVKSVYPSLTYCAHTTISTGTYPKRHGVINNTRLQAGRLSPDWYWYDRDIKVPTFQSYAKKAGYDILSIFWPVTAGSKDIKYNMPEIFANRWWQNQIWVSLKNGSPYFQYDLNSKFGKLRNGHKEPELDDFSHASFMYSLDKYPAHINMVHYIDLDSQRHEYGFNSKEAQEAMVRLDKRLGDLIEKLKEKGIYDDSVIVVLGDHSSIDGHTNIYTNKALERAGLLTKTDNNLVDKYKVICKSADGAAYIYGDSDVDDKTILDAINHLVEKGAIEAIYGPEQASELGADPYCRFMLEAAVGYFFKDEVENEELIRALEAPNRSSKLCINNHGYNPSSKENFETVFLVAGKGIKKNVFLEEMSLTDEGPTLAAILCLEMVDTDGRAIVEILEV